MACGKLGKHTKAGETGSGVGAVSHGASRQYGMATAGYVPMRSSLAQLINQPLATPGSVSEDVGQGLRVGNTSLSDISLQYEPRGKSCSYESSSPRGVNRGAHQVCWR